MKEKEIMEKLKTFKEFSRVFVSVVVGLSDMRGSIKELERRLTDLEKISGHITSIVSGANLRITSLEKQVEEHRKRWLE